MVHGEDTVSGGLWGVHSWGDCVICMSREPEHPVISPLIRSYNTHVKLYESPQRDNMLLALIVLLFRPQGLFGEKIIERV